MRARGVLARSYHAGMSSEERAGLEAWLSDPDPGRMARWVVSTSAFGLGIEFPRLYQVILWQPPPGLLSLAQFAGRVARAGRPGVATFLWHPEDFRNLDWLVAAGGDRAQEDLDQVREFCELPVEQALYRLGERFEQVST
jgi:superfamily II DNA helicase RecQ